MWIRSIDGIVNSDRIERIYVAKILTESGTENHRYRICAEVRGAGGYTTAQFITEWNDDKTKIYNHFNDIISKLGGAI